MSIQEALQLLDLKVFPLSEEEINKAYNKKMFELNNLYFSSFGSGDKADSIDLKKFKASEAKDFLLNSLSASSKKSQYSNINQSAQPQASTKSTNKQSMFSPLTNIMNQFMNRFNSFNTGPYAYLDFLKIAFIVILMIIFIRGILVKKTELTIYSEPPSEVFIDGKSSSWAPMNNPLTIQAGKHKITLISKTGNRI